MSKTGATLVVSALKSVGVRTIFTLSGNQIMPIFDACIDADIKLVHVRHEAAAVYMAEAWAQLNGDIGIALIPPVRGRRTRLYFWLGSSYPKHISEYRKRLSLML